MDAFTRPRIEAYIGATGTGKGASIQRRLYALAPARLLVWDSRDEYGQHATRFASLPELVAAFRGAGAGPLRARYVPGGLGKPAAAFELVCNLAFRVGDLVLVAEELSDTTSPSWAPPAWRRLITQGRHQRVHVLGAAQRPALIDKTFLGSASIVRVFGLRYARDVRAMAELLGVEPASIERLGTRSTDGGRTTIEYLERDFAAGTPARAGVLRLRRS